MHREKFPYLRIVKVFMTLNFSHRGSENVFSTFFRCHQVIYTTLELRRKQFSELQCKKIKIMRILPIFTVNKIDKMAIDPYSG